MIDATEDRAFVWPLPSDQSAMVPGASGATTIPGSPRLPVAAMLGADDQVGVYVAAGACGCCVR